MSKSIFPQTQTPITIPACRFWLDAADISTITSSSNLVSSVRDKSGNKNDATQGSGSNQPSTNGATISGKNVLAFDGSNDQLNIPTLIPAPQTTGFTIFLVAFPTNPVVGTRGVLDGGAGVGQRVYIRVSSGQVTAALGAIGVATINVSANTAAPFVADVRYVPVTHATTLVVNGTSSSVFNPQFTNSVGTMAIGVQSTASTPYFAGQIAECIIYNQALSDAERLQVRRYLANKWGIAI